MARTRAVKTEPMDTSGPKGDVRQRPRQSTDENPEFEIVGDSFVQNTYDAPLIKSDFKKYLDQISVEVINEDSENNTIEFDLVNVEAAIANTIRRIMIAEVPTMAFEKIYLFQNDTVFQDEVLCHRLGLLPVCADARQFNFPDNPVKEVNADNIDIDEVPEPDEKQHLVFQVKAKCHKKKVIPENTKDINDHYENGVVRSSAFEWIPAGNQADLFADNPPHMVHDDIVVLKMRHGQEIEALIHCVKGLGRDHAKFSPVGTASYRLLPDIVLKRRFEGDEAALLQQSFSKGVIEIDDDGAAYVANSRIDSLSRNVFRYDELKDDVEIRRKKNHFIFTVESVGQYKAHEIAVEACNIMVDKIKKFRIALQKTIPK